MLHHVCGKREHTAVESAVAAADHAVIHAALNRLGASADTLQPTTLP